MNQPIQNKIIKDIQKKRTVELFPFHIHVLGITWDSRTREEAERSLPAALAIDSTAWIEERSVEKKAIKKLTAERKNTSISFSVANNRFGMILMVEDEEGHSEPVAICSSAAEAGELATDHMRRRCMKMQGLIPYLYELWSQGVDGYVLVEKVVL